MMLNNKPLAVAGPEVDVAAINTRVDHLDLSLLQLQRQTESTLDRINSNIEDLIKSLPTADTEKLIYLKHRTILIFLMKRKGLMSGFCGWPRVVRRKTKKDSSKNY